MPVKSEERRKARINIAQIFTEAVKLGATDIHLHGGMEPMMRLHGEIVPINMQNSEILDNATLKAFTENYFTASQKSRFMDGEAIDWNYKKLSKLGTFRVNSSIAAGQVVI